MGLAILGGLIAASILLFVPITFFFGDKYIGVEDQLLPGLWLVLNYAGLIARQDYGREMAKVSCMMLILFVPIGTFMGILGWSLTKRTRHHFGTGRVIIQRVRREIKHRRKHGIG